MVFPSPTSSLRQYLRAQDREPFHPDVVAATKGASTDEFMWIHVALFDGATLQDDIGVDSHKLIWKGIPVASGDHVRMALKSAKRGEATPRRRNGGGRRNDNNEQEGKGVLESLSDLRKDATEGVTNKKARVCSRALAISARMQRRE
ncbi:hypothetical protein BHE74_00017017 [Ensete ventricosum]|nr:hypothetical protein GW17_00026222 [Ensete ventricosum]RWW74983.1 hypothetical protein BHE74_00017017 [Ensete ventricosum]RZR79303.1 hypothetical protein BHM03_00005009 [Ensete ventricosum]